MMGEPVIVMLVEDNADHAELVIRTLEDHRIANTILHFRDGQAALDYGDADELLRATHNLSQHSVELVEGCSLV